MASILGAVSMDITLMTQPILFHQLPYSKETSPRIPVTLFFYLLNSL